MKYEKSFEYKNPDLISEWDAEKNNGVKPSEVGAHSKKKRWWICENGHSYQSTPGKRTNGIGCPYCAGKRAIKGVNDLQTVNPTLASEWDYEKNGEVTPDEILPYSMKKYWWKCKKGHSWQAVIANRSSGNGCPYCAGKRAIKGETDLQTVNPKLASEWDYEKNGDVTPDKILPCSVKKYWWKCKKGHSWKARPYNRIKGNNCPYCAGRKTIEGES